MVSILWIVLLFLLYKCFPIIIPNTMVSLLKTVVNLKSKKYTLTYDEKTN